jgi:glycerol-3-phosphate dehydrogenase (NAD(P)+)
VGAPAEVSDTINAKHENLDYLPGVRLSEQIHATHDPDEALQGASIVALAVPSSPCGRIWRTGPAHPATRSS